MKQLVTLFAGIVLLVAVCPAAQAQMMGPGMPGGMGFGGHQIDHNLVIPQMAVGQDYATTLVLQNLGNSQMMTWLPSLDLNTTGTVYFYKQDGTPMSVTVNGGASASQLSFSLGPSASARYDLTAVGADSSGWALISVDNTSMGISWGFMDGQAMTGAMRIMANVFYSFQNAGQSVSRVGVTPSMYQMGLFLNAMVPVISQGSLSTGVAIVNTGTQTATIQAQLVDSSGQSFASKQISIAPGNQISEFVNQIFTGVPANFQGSLQIQTADEGVVAMGILMSGNIMTSIPMLHFGQLMLLP